jgi:release factor glutamine methyltransferase
VAAAERRLAAAGVASPRVDAELLIGRALGTTRTALYSDPERELPAEEAAEVEHLVGRRETREPLAYVLGEWGFRRLTLKVDRRVLVPRPETEVVVERCLELLRGLDRPVVLDVGTGSGAIALAIADEHQGARVTAIDVSVGALEVARENARAAELDVTFVEHDVDYGLEGEYDLVVSNPPYVGSEEIETLEPEVRDWEPRGATVAGETGLEAIERLVAQAPAALEPGGALVLEVGAGQAAAVAALLEGAGLAGVGRGPDHAGIERIVWGRAV